VQKNQIVKGSVLHVAKSSGQKLAEALSSAEIIVLFDSSMSMSARDRNVEGYAKSRYERACDELVNVQSNAPGKVAIVSFSNSAEWCLGGIPKFLNESTDLAGAFRFVRGVDAPGRKFLVISDGEPNDKNAALEIASTFQGEINCIYVGPNGGSGQDFLNSLSGLHGGTFVVNQFAEALGKSMLLMIEG